MYFGFSRSCDSVQTLCMRVDICYVGFSTSDSIDSYYIGLCMREKSMFSYARYVGLCMREKHVQLSLIGI
jgi:hypothetical protein